MATTHGDAGGGSMLAANQKQKALALHLAILPS